jgi:hypothetical protein
VTRVRLARSAPLLLVAVLAASLAHGPDAGAARARKKPPKAAKAAPKAEPAPEAVPVVVPEPIAVAPLVSARADGLRVVVAPAEGPAVLMRLVLSLDGTHAEHVFPGAALVVGSAVLRSGAAAAVLESGGALRDVSVEDNALVLRVNTLRERWKEDLQALLDAVSRPTPTDRELTAGGLAIMPVAQPADVDVLFRALAQRMVEPDTSLVLAEASPELINREAASWNVEELWASDRMTLVVVGQVDRADVDALVEQHFLVPASVPEPPRPAADPPRPLHEDDVGPVPGHVAYGAWAHGIPAEDALVLAEVQRWRIQQGAPPAGACEARYLPSARRSAVVAACSGVRGTALDVREVLGRLFDLTAVVPPTPEELSRARRAASVRLQADHASSTRMADRLVAFATAGLDGGTALETSVASTTDARLMENWQKLMTPDRFVRLYRKARTE